eukprot:8946918-Prorocentrum_lima.AAC.1
MGSRLAQKQRVSNSMNDAVTKTSAMRPDPHKNNATTEEICGLLHLLRWSALPWNETSRAI